MNVPFSETVRWIVTEKTADLFWHKIVSKDSERDG